ncbi:hypothetical protein PCASD_23670 [Puccinia coronata f. sp. avenae]|uniref:SEC63 domain-containing protein n=1 Tax=Puccinia coronata f. sp. avenae TaxID=200324 RepID=A0A2N5TL36_9BASI|nr:hypothetical protein PCASD_23670 [Puccinia coronata f. sp. avenae]
MAASDKNSDAAIRARFSGSGKHDLTIYNVNGFWLQRLIGSHFPDPIEAESKTKEAINLLLADNSSLRDLENSPVNLSDYDKFELFSFLTKHRDRIVWGTKWSRSDEDEKVKLAVVIREKGVGWIVKALTTGRGISNPQFQATGLTSNKMDIDTEETKPTKFPTKANLEANSFLPNPKKVLDLSSMVFNQGLRTMTNKKYKLPKGSHNRRQDKATKRFTSHLPKKLPSNLKIWLKSATCPFGAGKHSKARLPSAESKAKSFRSHLDRTTRLYYVHQPEQTNVAMLTVLNEISKHRNETTGEIDLAAFKIVYVAPMKALVHEMVGNFSSRLQCLGIQVGELTGDWQMTKDQIIMTQIIVTTPEKWDVITRKSTDTSYTNLVGLILSNEIHLLHDERGPVLEALFRSTLPSKVNFKGITKKKAIKRLQLTNEICYEKVMKQLNVKQQIIIFVHSRSETTRMAKNLKETSIERDEVGKFMSGGLATREILMETAKNVKVPGLKDILQFGMGIHHAGLERVDRRLVKELFADGHLQVLVSTATLAWGMLGRAGRPQYNTYGEGIIITNHSELQFHLSITTSQLPIESQLVSKLAHILNAEIVLGTIRNREEAAQWLGYTYWYQRALENPSLYGFQHDPKDPLLLQKRSDIFHTAFCILEKSRLAKYNRKTGLISTLELGKIASYYYVTNTSMLTYNQYLQHTMTLIELFRVFAASDEFKYVPTRPQEKQELAKLLEKVPIPVKESVGDPSAKINVLLQAYISRLPLAGFALMADMVYVTQSAGRILRALFEICLKRGWARLTHQALDLCKMVEKKMWVSMTPLRQFPSCSVDIIRRAERKDFPWYRFFDLEPPELGELT